MPWPLDKVAPRTGELSEQTLKLARYGNVKIELIGHALAVNQATTILEEYNTEPEAPVTTERKRDPPRQTLT